MSKVKKSIVSGVSQKSHTERYFESDKRLGITMTTDCSSSEPEIWAFHEPHPPGKNHEIRSHRSISPPLNIRNFTCLPGVRNSR